MVSLGQLSSWLEFKLLVLVTVAVNRDLGLINGRGHATHRWLVEEGGEGEFGAEGVADAGDDLGGEQGVAAEVEE